MFRTLSLVMLFVHSLQVQDLEFGHVCPRLGYAAVQPIAAELNVLHVGPAGTQLGRQRSNQLVAADKS